MEKIIRVDYDDNEIGQIEKLEAHFSPILHRAFSVFLFDGNKMLIQKRAKNKYHSSGLWANACCSHPRADMQFFDSVKNRLEFELGITDDAKLKEVFSFTYLSKYSENLYEHEYDHVLVGEYDSTKQIDFNKDEIEELYWIDIDDLKTQMIKYPTKFATWFIICAGKAINSYYELKSKDKAI